MIRGNGKTNMLKVGNLIAFIGVLVLNFLATYLPINGNTTGELSDKYPNLLVPPGFTFSIWGLIYIGLAAFIVYQFIDSRGGGMGQKSTTEKVGIYFILSCLGNMAWIVLWHYEMPGYALIAMLVILLSLIAIYIRINSDSQIINVSDKLAVNYPFSIYLGWITLATILNVTAILVDRGWNRFGISEEIWTIIIFVAILIISFISLKTTKDVVYNLVFIWALFGVAYRHQSILNMEYSLIYWGAIVSMVAILLMIFKLVFVDSRKSGVFKY